MISVVQSVVRKEETLVCSNGSLCATLPRPVVSCGPSSAEGTSHRGANPNTQTSLRLNTACLNCSTPRLISWLGATGAAKAADGSVSVVGRWSRGLNTGRLESALIKSSRSTENNNDALLSANTGGDETLESLVTGAMDLPSVVFQSIAGAG